MNVKTAEISSGIGNNTGQGLALDVLPPDNRSDMSAAGSLDLMKMYLDSMGRASAVLTPEEQADLAKRGQAGRLAAATLSGENRTNLDAADLERVKSLGEAATRRLFEGNLRLVVKIAKRYRNLGIRQLDLLQDGNEGLLWAVEKYDPSLGYRFSTYAGYWIKKMILIDVNGKVDPVYLPKGVRQEIALVRETQEKLTGLLNREPTARDIADALSQDTKKVEEAMVLDLEPVSLNQPAKVGQEKEIGDFIEDEGSNFTGRLIDSLVMSALLSTLMFTLTERQRTVIESHFGLLGEEPKSLADISREFGVTRQSICQIEFRGLQKMRNRAVRLGLKPEAITMILSEAA